MGAISSWLLQDAPCTIGVAVGDDDRGNRMIFQNSKTARVFTSNQSVFFGINFLAAIAEIFLLKDFWKKHLNVFMNVN